MASILDLFFSAHLDDTMVLKEARASGDKVGQVLGGRASSALGIALKGGLGVIAGGAAIAARGLAELDTITAKFAADTGASAEEAKRAGQAINEMAGRNLQPLSEIGDALTKVHTDLGLTGKAAEQTTEAFLKYATATGQNAASAVSDFDDVLDAWGLTAEDATGIMDKLVVSHQKYGGSIEENQKQLATFAPQLLALNATVDDGIGLLNLFAASGLDASKSTAALNKAVAALKPGQSLNDLIKQITSIEDPTLRAQKAVEIFGAKGGVALANALKPGITSLGDFEVSATDAAGATKKAAGVIENSFSNRVKLAIKAVGSEIIGVGQSVGPLITALAGLASLGGSLGLDKVLVKGWHEIAHSALLHGAAEKAGVVIGGIYGAAAGEATKIAEIAAEKWNEVLKSSLVKLLAGKAGSVVGAIYGAALGAASKLAEVVADLFVKLPFAPQVRSAVLAAGMQIGILQGTAVGQGVARAFALAPLVIPLLLIPTIQGGLPDITGKDINKQAADAFDRIRAGQPLQAAGNAGQALGQTFIQSAGAAIEAGHADIAQTAEKYGDAMVAAAKAWKPNAPALIVSKVFGSDLAAQSDTAKAYGRRMAAAAAAGIVDKVTQARSTVDQAWEALLLGLKNQITPTRERANLLGLLASKELAKGLKSGDPAVRAQAQVTRQTIIDRLNQLGANAKNIGKSGMDELRKAMKSKDPEIRAAARSIYTAATQPISKLPAAGTTYGSNFIKHVILGMNSQQNALAIAAAGLAGIARDHFQLSSPAKVGPWSKLGGPEGWGRRFGVFLSRGIESQVAAIRSASQMLAQAGVPAFPAPLTPAFAAPSLTPAFAAPSLASMSVPMAASLDPSRLAPVTRKTDIHVNVEGLLKAKDPFDVARTLGRFARAGVFDDTDDK